MRDFMLEIPMQRQHITIQNNLLKSKQWNFLYVHGGWVYQKENVAEPWKAFFEKALKQGADWFITKSNLVKVMYNNKWLINGQQ